MFRRYILIIISFSAIFLAPILASASAGDLPDIMTGQTTVKNMDTGNVYYGGMTGNEVILNYVPLISTDPAGQMFLGFNKDKLIGSADPTCLNGITSLSEAQCFKSNQTNFAGKTIKVMNSRTTVNGIPMLEVATLLYPDATVSGDVYGDLSNFNFWGRNLHTGAGAANLGQTWKLAGYTPDSNSQSSMSSPNYDEFLNKINNLYADNKITPISSIPGSHTWNLQNNSVAIGGGEIDLLKYPEGRIWSLGDSNPATDSLSLSGTYTYYGKGTLIIKGNLTALADTKIVSGGGDGDHLGIIVLGTGADGGTCNFGARTEINAYVFCQNQMKISYGSTFSGAFATKQFSNGASVVGTRFSYDPLSNNQIPPGFRYLNLPTAKQ